MSLFCLNLFAQTITRKVPVPYYPPLPAQPVVKMVVPRFKDNTNTTPTIASTSFTGSSPSFSPEVANSNFLQDMPVNKYTGTPNVQIPLCGIQEGNLGVSIGLNYNASGVRANQLAGWTGLGWDLVGIPTITRMVRGLPDEGKFEINSWTTSIERKGYVYGGLNNPSSNDDKEPDFFFLNIGGGSYKFFFDVYGTAHFMNDTDIKMLVNLQNENGANHVKYFYYIQVTMPNGTKYGFSSNDSEKTTEVEVAFAQTNGVYPSTANFRHYLKTNQVTSAWFCSRITSPFNQIINLAYNKVLYSYYKLADNEATGNCPTTVEKKLNRVFVESVVIDHIENEHTAIKFNDGYSFCYSLPHPVTLQPQNYCSLTGVPNREDIDAWSQNPENSSGAKILKNIVVYDKATPNEKMTWTFNYGYFSGTDNGGYDLPTGYSYAGTNSVGTTHKKRLKLSSIIFPDTNQSDFTYFGENTGFNFKTRFTYGVDHWGYINGADGNYALKGLIGNDYLGTCGSNRETDINFVKYGSLEKITHTGGSEISLEFEAHKANNYGAGLTNIGGLRIKKIRTKDNIRGTDIVKEYDYTAGGVSTGFMALKPIYRFDNYDGTRYVNSALYDILSAESGRATVGYNQVTETVHDYANTTYVGKNIAYYDQNLIELGINEASEYCYYDEITGEYICTPTTVYYLDNFIPQYDFRGGSQIKEENYNANNQKLSETTMAYTANGGILSDSIYCQRVVKLNGVNQTRFYYQTFRKYRIEETTSKTYSEDGSGTPLTNTTAFTYKDEMPLTYRNVYKGKHNLVVKTTTTDSYGFAIESHNKYIGDFNFDNDTTTLCEPDCYPQSPCEPSCQYYSITLHVPATGTEARGIFDMLQSLWIHYPIETISKRNNTVIAANYQTYGSFTGVGGGRGLAKSSYALRKIPKTTFSDVYFQKSTDLMVKDADYGTARSEVLSYNPFGMPVLIEIKRGATHQVLYDANHVVPLGSIKNYGIADAQTSLVEYTKYFQGASKQIAPNALEIRYQYRPADGLLETVKDKDGNILKKNSYQLKPTN